MMFTSTKAHKSKGILSRKKKVKRLTAGATNVAYGGKIAILLDCSGSMRGEKIEAAKRCYIEVENLARQAGLTISTIGFGDYVAFFIDEVDDIVAFGGTPMLPAIKMAYTKEVSRIILITDGRPHEPTDAILGFVYSTPRIDTIGISSEYSHAYDPEFLRALARKTGGTFREVGAGIDDLFREVEKLLLIEDQSDRPKVIIG